VPLTIDDVIREREITRLVHFTQLVNVPSILTNGLVPRNEVTAKIPGCAVNDAHRYDGRTDANCLSVTFPNSRMFYAYQQQDTAIQWAVLLFSPRTLVEKDVLFCRHNAADGRISGLPDDQLRDPTVFEGIFEEIEDLESRADQNLKPADPTDVQAELLVRGTIEPSFIDGVVFPGIGVLNDHRGLLGDKAGYISDRRGLYGDRRYYRTWGRGK
jgi:hypothetical protein